METQRKEKEPERVENIPHTFGINKIYRKDDESSWEESSFHGHAKSTKDPFPNLLLDDLYT